MKIVLHVGAHRTATSSFQHFLWVNRLALARTGVTVWTPRRTRDGLMSGMMKHPALITLPDEVRAQRSVGRVRMEVARLERIGQHTLLVSEENLLGTAMNNLSDTHLYPLLQERMRRVADTFGDRHVRIVLTIRSYESYWTSVLGYALQRGHQVPGVDLLDWLVTQPRRWRHLVRDIAAALPGAEILVWPFERAAGRHKFQLRTALGTELPHLVDDARWHNRSGTLQQMEDLVALRGETLVNGRTLDPLSRWTPFAEDHRAVLRAEYRQDLAWLEAGADGLATYHDGRQKPAQGPDRGEDMTARTVVASGQIGGRRYGVEERLG